MPWTVTGNISEYAEHVYRKMQAAVAAENESCAKRAESMIGSGRREIAAEIRARLKTKPPLAALPKSPTREKRRTKRV